MNFRTLIFAGAVAALTATAAQADCAGAQSTLIDRQRYGLTGPDGTNNDLLAACPALRNGPPPVAWSPPDPARCVMGGLIGALAGCTPPPPQPQRVVPCYSRVDGQLAALAGNLCQWAPQAGGPEYLPAAPSLGPPQSCMWQRNGNGWMSSCQ